MSDKPIKIPAGTPLDEIFSFIEKLARVHYMDAVMTYLEYLEYPDMVTEYRAEDVARSINGTMNICHKLSLSYRMCALIIFGATYQKIASMHSTDTKH